MKKRILQVVLGILLLLLLAIAGFGVLYAGRLRTVNSIEQLTNYDDYNLYRMISAMITALMMSSTTASPTTKA